MSDAVRITHHMALVDDGAHDKNTVKHPVALAALTLKLRSEPELTCGSSGERLSSGDWRPVVWIRTG